MDILEKQLAEAKQENKDAKDDSWYVDDCNNCKTDVATKDAIRCNHPFYCYHDNGEVQELEYNILKIKQDIEISGSTCRHQQEELKILNNKRFKLIGRKKKEWFEKRKKMLKKGD